MRCDASAARVEIDVFVSQSATELVNGARRLICECDDTALDRHGASYTLASLCVRNFGAVIAWPAGHFSLEHLS